MCNELYWAPITKSEHKAVVEWHTQSNRKEEEEGKSVFVFVFASVVVAFCAPTDKLGGGLYGPSESSGSFITDGSGKIDT